MPPELGDHPSPGREARQTQGCGLSNQPVRHRDAGQDRLVIIQRAGTGRFPAPFPPPWVGGHRGGEDARHRRPLGIEPPGHPAAGVSAGGQRARRRQTDRRVHRKVAGSQAFRGIPVTKAGLASRAHVVDEDSHETRALRRKDGSREPKKTDQWDEPCLHGFPGKSGLPEIAASKASGVSSGAPGSRWSAMCRSSAAARRALVSAWPGSAARLCNS